MIQPLQFLSGGGKMGEIIRSFDWSTTAVGSPDTWPQSLRTAARIMLDCPFGMYIAWGEEYIQLYNDGYRPILGVTKHPQALGISTRKTFEEAWDTIGPMFDAVMEGTPVGFPDFILHLDRNGFMEECVFDFSYSPIRLEDGEIGGVLVTVIETTEKVNAAKALKESEQQLKFAIEATELGTWDYNPLTNKFTGNNRLKEWFGLPHEAEIDLSLAIEVMIEKDRSLVADAIQKALEYESGGLYDIDYGIINPVTKQERIVRAKGRAWFGEDKAVYRFNGTLQDITEQAISRRKIEESEENLRNTILQAPVAMCIFKGENLVLDLANDRMYELWGKTANELLNKPIFEGLPEAKNQGFEGILHDVYTTGKTFAADGVPITLPRKKGIELVYVNFVYEPYREADGTISGILAVAIDVTAQLSASKIIEESEHRFRFVLEQSPDPILILKGENLVLEIANEALFKIWGVDKNALGKPFLEILPEMKEQGFFDMLQDVYFNNKIIKGIETPVLFNRPDRTKETVYFNFTYQPYREEDGKITGVLVIASNVTRQVEVKKQIEESEQDLKRYKHMADNANEPFILMRQDGTFAYLNDLALERWGYTKEDVHELRVPDVDPIYNDENFNSVFAAAQNEKILQFETLHKKKDGTIYPVEINMGGLSLEGKPHMFAIARDITERKKLENAVRESEKKIRSFILQAPVAMCLYRGPQYIIEIVNEELLAIWDKSLESVNNKPVFEALPAAKGQGFEGLLEKVYTTGEKFEAFGIPITLTRNGKPKTIYVNIVYQAYREVDGSISGIVEVVSDVTDHVIATQQIQASENQFRTFADSIQNLAWIANGEGWIYWYNQQWYDYTGTSFDEMEGWGWQKVHHPDHVETILELTKKLWKKDEAFELTFPLRRYDGVYRWFLTRAYPIKNASGNIERWIGTNTDITEQKSFTEELEKKVAERTEELNEKNLSLELTNAELKSFSYIASHDLKEPLRKIQAFSKRIIETENFSDKTQDYFNRIISAGERMQNLIDSLLDFSRVNTIELIFEPCDLNTLVEESKNDLHISIIENQATIEYESLPVITGVYIQISQLITNLLDNAIKYRRPEIKPLIKITSSIIEGRRIDHTLANQQTKYHAIKFEDNGIGFEQEYANKIFELFQRLHGKNEYSGTGIGLGIVKKIATNHNGFITAKGNPNVGSTFTLYIPTV